MADCLLDLVLQAGQTELPPVQVLLTVVASVGTMAGGDEPGEIDGHVVPAEMIRELLRALAPPQQPALPEPQQSTDPRPSECRAGLASHAGSTGQTFTEDSDLRAWQEIEQEELERWWAETERRVLAGELGDGPDPLPDAATAFVGPGEALDGAWPDISPWPSGGPPDGPPAAEGPPNHDSHGAAPPERIPRQSTAPDDAASNDRGWWARADRAVEDAGLALRRAEAALSHAGRLVDSACASDAAEEATWQAGPGGRVTAAEDAVEALRSATEDQRAWLADLLARTGGGGLVERPRIALTDRLSGTLFALTALPELRRAGHCGAVACRRDPTRCEHDLAGRPGLGPPRATDGYRPSDALDRWVRARDRRCRFPGCRRRVPRGGELDHHRPYPLGPTDAANLVGYCTTDHRGKHQAPGWQHALAADGTLTVTTPTGLTAVTTPAPY